ncbi:MAG TPA: DNA-binding response regulator [Candidatus Binatia bacterium]|nr:DNA-binding response regulator [Candidatus Binatia bacterium]
MSARILIIDDDAVSCRLLAKVLEGEGHQAEGIQSGEAALTRLRNNAHELLVIDVQMPGISGLDVSQEEHSYFASSPTLAEVDKRYIQCVLSRTQDNVSHAAKILDIDRRSLYRMLERFKVAPFHKGL